MKILNKILTFAMFFCIATAGIAHANSVKKLEEMAKKGNVDAQYELAFMYYDGDGVKQDFKKAYEWFEKGANQGDADCQYNLAQMLRQGKGVKADPKKAFDLYNKSAAQGDTFSHFALAIIYRDGENVKVDNVKAYAHFIKASAEVDQAKKGYQDLAKKMTNAQINEAKALANKMK